MLHKILYNFDHFAMRAEGGIVKRRGRMVISGIHVCSVFDEQFHDFEFRFQKSGRIMKRRIAAFAACIDILAIVYHFRYSINLIADNGPEKLLKGCLMGCKN